MSKSKETKRNFKNLHIEEFFSWKDNGKDKIKN